MSGTGRRGGFNPLIAGFIASLVIVVVLATLAKINLDFAAPWSQTHTLTAQVSDVDGISVGSDVRIAGRLVGQITGVTSKATYSEITFHIDQGDWPLPSDSTASVRLATLLGQKYLQLVPGNDANQQLADSGTITLKATKPVVDFDQILNTFDKPTRDSLTNLIKTGAAAVRGQEGTLQQLLPSLRDLSVHSVLPTQELVTRNAEINNILINLGITADQLDRSSNDLAGVIDNMNSITGALARNQGALEGYIANTTALNQTTDAVLGNGGAQNFNAGLRQLGTLTTQLNQLMRDLVPETSNFATHRSRATGLPIWQDAKNLVFQIGSATSQSDKNGFYLRQYANGADICALLSATCAVTNPGSAPPPSGTCLPAPLPALCAPNGPPTLPSLPPLPTLPNLALPIQPPTIPTLPPVTVPPPPLAPIGNSQPAPPQPTQILPIPIGVSYSTQSVGEWLSVWSWL